MQVTADLVAEVVERVIPHIAFDLRPDVLAAMERAAAAEGDPRGKLVLDQLLQNSRIAAQDRVPLCQDTGTVWVCLELGADDCSLASEPFAHVDAAVGRAYRAGKLRMSTLRDALVERTNPGDNTPAFTELKFVPGRGAKLHIMLKGGGSDNASQVEMLPPGAGWDGVRELVLARVRKKASSACPPLIVGVGVGATFDKVGGLAKHALLRPVGTPNPDERVAALEAELLAAVNATGIGPGALGGACTALACNIETAPCHIAALPVAVNMGCSAMRSISVDLARYEETGELPW
ncbi:MAG: fumarate hydratase [Coriobacteriales bacterium]